MNQPPIAETDEQRIARYEAERKARLDAVRLETEEFRKLTDSLAEELSLVCATASTPSRVDLPPWKRDKAFDKKRFENYDGSVPDVRLVSGNLVLSVSLEDNGQRLSIHGVLPDGDGHCIPYKRTNPSCSCAADRPTLNIAREIYRKVVVEYAELIALSYAASEKHLAQHAEAAKLEAAVFAALKDTSPRNAAKHEKPSSYADLRAPNGGSYCRDRSSFGVNLKGLSKVEISAYGDHDTTFTIRVDGTFAVALAKAIAPILKEANRVKRD